MVSPTIPNLFHEFPGDGSSHRLADFGDAAGRLKWPSNGARAQRMMSARPPRNTAAEIDFKRSPWASPPWSFVRRADLRLQPEKADFCKLIYEQQKLMLYLLCRLD
jgi:hypothetical protein